MGRIARFIRGNRDRSAIYHVMSRKEKKDIHDKKVKWEDGDSLNIPA
ncbi:hypothetical protein SAMN05660653_02618 [Desulfonatronum thiosulfatophilum]|uniref:Uncharacterized protein n=1 Tax=Desulfonatronum thiosulfatophilum TaxID=617002 RepID=A0A1G6E4K6_9BACT|nr:hypothetical protein SAMN05660653_02618 [Desulfonatronum thiosulfatophilum]